MRIETPATFNDISISQIQEQGERELTGVDLIECYSNLAAEDLRNYPKKMTDKAAAHLTKILASPTQSLITKFKLNDVEYGFISDWSKLSSGEYIDIKTYLSDPIANAHKVLAVLYRPIKRNCGKKWTIEDYKGTANAGIYKPVSAGVYYGALSFFLTTTVTYQIDSLRSLDKQLRQILTREVKQYKTSTAKNGVGTIFLTIARAGTYLKSKLSPSYLSPKS